MSRRVVTDPTVVVSNRCHQRKAAAAHLGMSVRSFAKIAHTIPHSPILPGSVVLCWRESDLDRWRLRQMRRGGQVATQPRETFEDILNSLP